MNGIGLRPYCLWERVCGPDLRQGSLATRSSHGNGNSGRLPGRLRAGSRSLYILLSFLPPPPSPGLFFPFSRVELCFHPLSFLIPSFLRTGCWSSHPLEQCSPSFTSTAPYSNFSKSNLDNRQDGKSHLARVLTPCRYHCECL